MKKIICALLLLASATLAPKNIYAFVVGQSANTASQDSASAASQTTADRDAFVEAVKRGDTDAVRNFLSRGVSPNAKDADDNLALNWALRRNRAEIVRLLLERGADVNASESDGDTPLMIAVTVGRLEFTRELVSRGAKVDALDKGGHTPLISAAMGALFKLMPELFAQAMFGGDEASEITSLRQNIGDEHSQVMSLLLDRGADANAQAHDCGLTALMIAALGADLPAARLLVARGADVNRRNGNFSPLVLASMTEEQMTKEMLGDGEATDPAAQRSFIEWLRATAPDRKEIARILKGAGAKK